MCNVHFLYALYLVPKTPLQKILKIAETNALK